MKSNPVPLIAILLLWTHSLSAQDDIRYQVLLKSGTVTPEKNITTDKLNAFNQKALRTAGKTYAILQFENIPGEMEQQQLKQAGIELLEYIPNNAYTVTISGSLNNDVLVQVNARAFITLTPEQKMEPLLARDIYPSWAVKIPGTVDVWISFPKTFLPKWRLLRPIRC